MASTKPSSSQRQERQAESSNRTKQQNTVEFNQQQTKTTWKYLHSNGKDVILTLKHVAMHMTYWDNSRGQDKKGTRGRAGHWPQQDKMYMLKIKATLYTHKCRARLTTRWKNKHTRHDYGVAVVVFCCRPMHTNNTARQNVQAERERNNKAERGEKEERDK